MKIKEDNYENGFGMPPGEYPFKVVKAEEDKTKSRKCDMIKLALSVDIPRRKEPVNCYDELVNMPKSLFKIEQFLKSTGQSKKFRVEGTVAECNLTVSDCLGKTGKVRLARNYKTNLLRVSAYV